MTSARQPGSHPRAATRDTQAVVVLPPTSSGAVNALGKVTAILPGGIYSVETDARMLRCLRAASCLLRPEIGDTVLVSGPDEARLYLTAVAEQANSDAACIEVAGDLTLSSHHGAVKLKGATELHLSAPRALRMESNHFHLNAEAAECHVGQMSYQGVEARATVLNMRVVGRVYEAIVDRLVHLSKSALRMTDGVDVVEAGQLDYKAKEMARLHGRNTLLTAEDLIKADAKQIHMG